MLSVPSHRTHPTRVAFFFRKVVRWVKRRGKRTLGGQVERARERFFNSRSQVESSRERFFVSRSQVESTAERFFASRGQVESAAERSFVRGSQVESSAERCSVRRRPVGSAAQRFWVPRGQAVFTRLSPASNRAALHAATRAERLPRAGPP